MRRTVPAALFPAGSFAAYSRFFVRVTAAAPSGEEAGVRAETDALLAPQRRHARASGHPRPRTARPTPVTPGRDRPSAAPARS
jgi:hypothetical protein